MGTFHGESAVWVRDRAARTRLGVYLEGENVLGYVLVLPGLLMPTIQVERGQYFHGNYLRNSAT